MKYNSGDLGENAIRSNNQRVKVVWILGQVDATLSTGTPTAVIQQERIKHHCLLM